MPDPICDFCGSTVIAWRYPALSFDLAIIRVPSEPTGELRHVEWGSLTDWAACETCSALIEAGEWDTLAERGVDHSPQVRVLPADVRKRIRPEVLRATKELHKNFKKARTANRVPHAG